MKWMKFRIKTITDAEDIIISTLYDIGLEGAQIEDKVPLTALEKELGEIPIIAEDLGIITDDSAQAAGRKRLPGDARDDFRLQFLGG